MAMALGLAHYAVDTDEALPRALEIAEQIGIPEWLDVDVASKKGVFKMTPERNELSADINEALVVALYSK